MTIGGNYGYDAFAIAQSGISGNMQSASVQQGTLETSNTNMTDAMVNQMTAQNAVEANAQSIKTADSMMQSLLDIKA